MTGALAYNYDFTEVFDESNELTKDFDTSNMMPLPSALVIPKVEGVDWRDYQVEAMEGCWEAFQEGYNRIYYKMTVSGGKTLTSAAIADNWLREDKPVLWLAHNKRLLKQACEDLAKLGWNPLLEQGENSALTAFTFGMSKLVVASVATLRGERLRTWDRDAFGLIVYDECDMALAPRNVDIIRYFRSAKLLGMTGTDDRGDGKNLGTLFEKRIDSLDLIEATRKGMVVPIVRNKIMIDPPLDLRDLKESKGDFRADELSPIVQRQSEIICSALAQERYKEGGIGDRPTMVFAPDIKSSEAIAENLKKFGFTARALHSKLPTAVREAGERAFVSGDYQILVNAVAYTVGTNFPFVSCIVLLRATKVRRLLEQIIGRGVRLPDRNPLSQGKKDCLVIDFPWLIGDQHELVYTEDIYDDGSLPDPVRDRIKEIMDTEKVDYNEAEAQAEKEDEIRRYRLDWIDFQRREVQVKSMTHDPMSIMEFIGSKTYTPNDARTMYKPVPFDVLETLRSFKVPNADALNYGQAMRAKSQLERRRNRGECTIPQGKLLISLGVDPHVAKKMKIKEASAMIDQLLAAKRSYEDAQKIE